MNENLPILLKKNLNKAGITLCIN